MQWKPSLTPIAISLPHSGCFSLGRVGIRGINENHSWFPGELLLPQWDCFLWETIQTSFIETARFPLTKMISPYSDEESLPPSSGRFDNTGSPLNWDGPLIPAQISSSGSKPFTFRGHHKFISPHDGLNPWDGESCESSQSWLQHFLLPFPCPFLPGQILSPRGSTPPTLPITCSYGSFDENNSQIKFSIKSVH